MIRGTTVTTRAAIHAERVFRETVLTAPGLIEDLAQPGVDRPPHTGALEKTWEDSVEEERDEKPQDTERQPDSQPAELVRPLKQEESTDHENQPHEPNEGLELKGSIHCQWA